MKQVMMAFAKGKTVTGEGDGSFKRYTGVGVCSVVAVNPTKAELEQIYNTPIEKDPEYLSKSEDGVAKVRIDFIIKTVPEKNDGIELIHKVSFFLSNAGKYNKDKAKIEVINKYGETTWVPVEMAKKGELPENMKWYPAPYRPAYVGERDLNAFLKVFLAIPARSWRDSRTGEVHTVEDLTTAEASLEEIKKYFTGNVKELRDIVAMQPDNKIKVAFGIKTTEEGKEYQDVFNRLVLRSGARDNSRLAKAIKEAQDSGAYSSTVFTTGKLEEYAIEATHFEDNSDAPEAATKGDGFFD